MGLVDTLAASIVTNIEAMTVTFTANSRSYTSTVNGFAFAPADLDGTPPWAVVELPDIQRVPADQPEFQIGSTSWTVTFPVVFYFALDNPAYAQAQAVNTVEAFIKTVDANPTLGDNAVIDTKVTQSGPPVIEVDQQNALIVYPCTVEIVREV